MCVIVSVRKGVIMNYLKTCVNMYTDLLSNKKLIYKLAKNDFKTRFAGSFFGMFWAFVQPVITILIYLFVFSVGFKTPSVDDCPFVLFLTSGLVPWFFFSEAWNGATGSLLEYSYLVKKVVFNINVLPVVKVLSAIFVSMFFHGFMCLLFVCFGYFPSIYWLQLLYYIACVFLFALAISYVTCSIMPFFRDLGQIMNIILQIGVWMTPIMWDVSILSENYRWIMKINPFYYIVQGYRNSLIYNRFFWEDGLWTAYFWVIILLLFLFGSVLFKKMKPQYADVL